MPESTVLLFVAIRPADAGAPLACLPYQIAAVGDKLELFLAGYGGRTHAC
jgi:hypothetical protein